MQLCLQLQCQTQNVHVVTLPSSDAKSDTTHVHAIRVICLACDALVSNYYRWLNFTGFPADVQSATADFCASLFAFVQSSVFQDSSWWESCQICFVNVVCLGQIITGLSLGEIAGPCLQQSSLA